MSAISPNNNGNFQGSDDISGVGVLLLQHSPLKPMYVNEDALRILIYPKNPLCTGIFDDLLEKKIRSELFDSDFPQSPPPTEFVSGRRRYSCRVFSADSNSNSPTQVITVLLERSPRQSGAVAQIAAEFNLTEREQETVECLLEGLTSKEIAECMKISPNTVKTFLRLVMIKMGVATRSGILGKIVATQF